MSTVNVKYNGTHPHMLPDGRSVVPDETVGEVDAEHPEIAPLLRDGTFTEVEPPSKQRQRKSNDEEVSR